jgi:fatty acid desaturase
MQMLKNWLARNMNSQSAPDHLWIIRNLNDDMRKTLRQKSNYAGLIHLFVHAGLVASSGLWIFNSWPGWQLVLLPHGIILIFLFTLLHECVHDTPFRSQWLNRLLGTIIGFAILLPPTWFRYFHLAHHRHTHDPAKDPELSTPKPGNWQQYIVYLSGIPTWAFEIRTIIRLSIGRTNDQFVPKKAQFKVRTEARIFLVAYATLAFVSVISQNSALLWIWVLPLLLGQPFLCAYLLAEHTFCPHVANMLENTRTTYTLRFVRFITWNMPYHTEHHCYPVVPFHKLPLLHSIMRDKLQHTVNGYSTFHAIYMKSL